jgi:signal transduction histidine kinase
VEVPAGRIEQILLNLIVNASEAMQGNGRLRITVNPAPPAAASRCLLPPHPAAAYVEIAVADTGPGVPSGIADRIFEPFFTTKNAGNDRGTGLGLSMVYTIAERDHMGLALHSIPSEGATFSVFIPITGPGVPERPTDKMDIPA